MLQFGQSGTMHLIMEKIRQQSSHFILATFWQQLVVNHTQISTIFLFKDSCSGFVSEWGGETTTLYWKISGTSIHLQC